MYKDWFKYETAMHDKEEGYYGATSSFFDKFIFSWQRIAPKMYSMEGQWMVETGKRVPEPIRKMVQITETITKIYDIIPSILEELITGCYFDDVE